MSRRSLHFKKLYLSGGLAGKHQPGQVPQMYPHGAGFFIQNCLDFRRTKHGDTEEMSLEKRARIREQLGI